MRSTAKAPGPLASALLGWQASRIGEPVLRLRFLRRTVGDRRIWDPRTASGRAWARSHRRSLGAVFAALLLVPAGSLQGLGLLWDRPPVITASANSNPPIASVWVVEQKDDHETYSNGLRIERRYEIANQPRRFSVYRRGAEDSAPPEPRTAPAGIVFHTTESASSEFTADKTRRINIIGTALLEYVRAERAYNYVVDKFGRVWRVVRESDAANHAGHSVWADSNHTYIGLNRAFLGVSVETITQAGSSSAEATPAQIHALRILTEMLRSKYRISADDCVTHAQVSVNPSNMQAGYHYDWAANFPYAQVGLPDNYALPTPSVWAFGFTWDPSLVTVTGQPFWKGLLLGEEQLRQNATAHAMAVPSYRQALEKRYRKLQAASTQQSEPLKEKEG